MVFLCFNLSHYTNLIILVSQHVPFVFPVPISRQRTFFFLFVLSLCLEARESFRKVILPRITEARKEGVENG